MIVVKFDGIRAFNHHERTSSLTVRLKDGNFAIAAFVMDFNPIDYSLGFTLI
jgi:hypothetical protein